MDLLKWRYADCAGAFATLFDFETDSLALIESFKTSAGNGAIVYKNISTFIVFNKPEPLLLVKPFYLSFCQCLKSPFLNLSPAAKTVRKLKKTAKALPRERALSGLSQLYKITSH